MVALVELLLLLSACCFADHIRKLQRGDSEKSGSEKEGIMDGNEEAYSIHHEESKSRSAFGDTWYEILALRNSFLQKLFSA